MTSDLSTPLGRSRAIKHKALELGLDACGIAVAGPLDEEAGRLDTWLSRGYQADMAWMFAHGAKRTDPTLLMEGAQSIVSVLQSYWTPHEGPSDPALGRISRYAWGDDYHLRLKERLHALLAWIQEVLPGTEGRAFVDSAPVMDKAWAARAGLGWIGKHSNLISRDHGSWTFIGELVITAELDPDRTVADHCGTCTACLDACPTGAIVEPYVVDANRCISWTTIENRAADIDPALAKAHGNWIFGCDICQEVCPWNKFRTPTSEPAYLPREGVLDTSLSDWATLDADAFRARFRRSAVKRTKLDGFRRNVDVALENSRAADGGEPSSDAEA
ncbi:MAG: tRNA epoxyqueuosine(34) reductase QueG [Bacteroidetes bacterium]|nr:tRNA epoxyqueuosine(34) reductase QueG [Bacteroidota bacterium]MDA0873857.1 tRNA epoxyqueuosine(34) reductase QueG [Bacteroidota bacterium]